MYLLNTIQVIHDEKMQVIHNEKMQVIHDEKMQAIYDEKMQVIHDEKMHDVTVLQSREMMYMNISIPFFAYRHVLVCFSGGAGFTCCVIRTNQSTQPVTKP